MILKRKVITRNDYFRGRDTLYPEDYNVTVEANAVDLIERVNKLLGMLGDVFEYVEVSSGFRPNAVNKNIQHAATKSYHLVGKAVDLKFGGKEKEVFEYIVKNYKILSDLGLWMEDYVHTKGWIHLDTGSRAQRKIRVFLP